jgi:hypothetical protein
LDKRKGNKLKKEEAICMKKKMSDRENINNETDIYIKSEVSIATKETVPISET